MNDADNPDLIPDPTPFPDDISDLGQTLASLGIPTYEFDEEGFHRIHASFCNLSPDHEGVCQ